MENRHHSNHPSNVARRHAPTYSELHAKFSAIFTAAIAAAGDEANAAFDIRNPSPDIFSGAGDGREEFIEWIADEFATLFLDSVSESFIDQLEKDAEQ